MAECDSEWHLEPMVFGDQLEAMRFAVGIAKSWNGKLNPPAIRIYDLSGKPTDWTVFGLISISYFMDDDRPED